MGRGLLAAAVLAALCGAAPVRAAAANLDAVNTSAQKDLDASLAELAALRESIRVEKVPLNEELTRLEAELAGLRRESERSSRDTDAGSLELTSLKSEVKLRQDELTYVGTLLDEYRANFETRINVSEIQRYAPVIDAARNAPGNGNLSSEEKFRQQIALVKTSVARLEDVIGGSRFEGQAIDPQGAVTDGKFALIGPIALFATPNGKTSGLALAQTGSTKPAVRPIEAGFGAGILAVVSGGTGQIPVDPSRGGALKELVQRTNIIHLFVKGGPIMWPLLLASILALGTVIERIVFLVTERRRRDSHALQQMLDSVEMGRISEALTNGRRTNDFVCRALTYALEHREKSISNALVLAQSIELKRFSRGIAILDTVITLAPLLGLLGTVTGMMRSFALIGGELSAPGAITGGIAEALIATAFGLAIAITALIPFNFLNSRVEEARHELDAAATRLELLLHPEREWPATPAAVTAAAPLIPHAVANG
jgi:biopolymer transport protein ExbB